MFVRSCFKKHYWPSQFPSFSKWTPLNQNGGILALLCVMYCSSICSHIYHCLAVYGYSLAYLGFVQAIFYHSVSFNKG